MRKLLTVVLLLPALALVVAAADAKPGDRDSIVITFKDGHQQAFPVSDIARIEFKAPARTAAAVPPSPSASSPGHFLGRWRVGDGQGKTFIITLDRNGNATKSQGRSRGTWTVVNGEARINWDDGWHDAIRKVGNKYEKVAYSPGKTFSDEPANIADAKSLEPI